MVSQLGEKREAGHRGEQDDKRELSGRGQGRKQAGLPRVFWKGPSREGEEDGGD